MVNIKVLLHFVFSCPIAADNGTLLPQFTPAFHISLLVGRSSERLQFLVIRVLTNRLLHHVRGKVLNPSAKYRHVELHLSCTRAAYSTQYESVTGYAAPSRLTTAQHHDPPCQRSFLVEFLLIVSALTKLDACWRGHFFASYCQPLPFSFGYKAYCEALPSIHA